MEAAPLDFGMKNKDVTGGNIGLLYEEIYPKKLQQHILSQFFTDLLRSIICKQWNL